jgi:hypothetical protein
MYDLLVGKVYVDVLSLAPKLSIFFKSNFPFREMLGVLTILLTKAY